MWDRLTPEERARVIESLPSEFPVCEEARLRAESEQRLVEEMKLREETERKLTQAFAELERLRQGRP